ncbi:uncharacterized protein METZ01_LOCUS146984 [marine metagenome]|uniref:Uncharacterized protein n=1 Tax=marine metagenome TaxID=408172 RepID=A0A381ZY30_9ZZZZ
MNFMFSAVKDTMDKRSYLFATYVMYLNGHNIL